MNILILSLLTSFACLISACAGQPIASGEIDTSPAMPTEPLKPPQDVSTPVANTPLPPPTTKVPSPPAVEPTPTATKPAERTWTMKNGKIQGTDQPSPKLISKIKDPKSGQTITSTCFKFSDFAIEEVRATGEIGAAEINVRRASSPGQSLCSPDFKGMVKNLPAIEGFFAGATPDFVVVEGADPAEAIPNFQLISLKTMKQVYKNRHEPSADIVITKRADKTSLVFHATMNVKCELAIEGAKCWKDVLLENTVSNHAPMPDCKATYAKAKVALEEPALVTMRAQVRDIEKPKVEFLGGASICRPEK